MQDAKVVKEAARRTGINGHGVRDRLRQYDEPDTVALMGLARWQAEGIKSWPETNTTRSMHNELAETVRILTRSAFAVTLEVLDGTRKREHVKYEMNTMLSEGEMAKQQS